MEKSDIDEIVESHLKNGKVVERWAFSDDTAAIVAFFA